MFYIKCNLRHIILIQIDCGKIGLKKFATHHGILDKKDNRSSL